MATRCILSTTVDYACLERLDAEAERRGVTRTALAREVIQAAFPPPVAAAPANGAPEEGGFDTESDDE